MKRTPLKRKAWMRRSSKRMKRSRIKPRNHARATKLEREAFGAPARVARCMDCCVWTCPKRAPSQAAHFRSRGAGGKSHQLAPLCHGHHREQEASTRKFEERYRFKIRAEDGSLVLCETLQEVASYIADLVRAHVCTATPEKPKGRRARCYVCRRPLTKAEIAELAP